MSKGHNFPQVPSHEPISSSGSHTDGKQTWNTIIMRESKNYANMILENLHIFYTLEVIALIISIVRDG